MVLDLFIIYTTMKYIIYFVGISSEMFDKLCLHAEDV